MARRAKQGDWQAEAGEIFEQILAANSAVNDAVILLAEGERDKTIIAPVYDPARAMRLSAEDATTAFMEHYNPRTAKGRDTVRAFAAHWALPRMYRALSDNFAIARVLVRLRHNQEEIPVDEEDLQGLGDMHERVNMNLALCGSLFSRYRNASIGAMTEFLDQSKQLGEIVDGQLGGIEQTLRQALGE
jgi:hypothetical protein